MYPIINYVTKKYVILNKVSGSKHKMKKPLLLFHSYFHHSKDKNILNFYQINLDPDASLCYAQDDIQNHFIKNGKILL
jgi:hypothetical protein